jgi:hypothetical protein
MAGGGWPTTRASPKLEQSSSAHFHCRPSTGFGRVGGTGGWPAWAIKLTPPGPGTGAYAGEPPPTRVIIAMPVSALISRTRGTTGVPAGSTSIRPSSDQRRMTMRSFDVSSVSDIKARSATTYVAALLSPSR